MNLTKLDQSLDSKGNGYIDWYDELSGQYYREHVEQYRTIAFQSI